MLQLSQTTSNRIKVKFFFGELQSVCKLHHESAKKREEARGYSTQIGPDGWQARGYSTQIGPEGWH
jgi:hypothetical protein